MQKKHDKVLELLELNYKFAGPLPEHVVDECRIPTTSSSSPKGDPLKEGESVPALALVAGRTENIILLYSFVVLCFLCTKHNQNGQEQDPTATACS